MPYTNYADWLVDSSGNVLSKAIVPESCIQSAETIIQQIYHGGGRISRSTHMFAHFKNLTFDASTDDVLSYSGSALKSYQTYDWLPDYGQGIVLLNKTSGDLQYNMHFGTVVAWKSGEAVISHMFEQVPNSSYALLQVITIASAVDFAQKTFGSGAGNYAIGLLTAGR